MLVNRRGFLTGGAAVVAAAALGRNPAGGTQAGRRAQAAGEQQAPDIIFILTDDQDAGSLDARARENGQWVPVMRNLLGGRGGGWTRFTRATTNHAICAPARATLLTGLYSNRHGVEKNGWIGRMDATRTLPVWLKAAGYRTALRGKYSFGKKDGNIPRPPGWDVWEPGGGLADAVFARGVEIVRDTPAGTPLFLCLWPVDPHAKAKPPERYRNMEIELPAAAPSVNEADVSDKPRRIREMRPIRPGKLLALDEERRQAARALMAVDDGIRAVMDALEARGRLDNAVIVFAGDHGIHWGEHRLERKDSPYLEAVRFPLLIRDPATAAAGNRAETRLISNADIAPTLADMAGVTPPTATDGRSVLGLTRGLPGAWDETAYIRKPTGTGRDAGTFEGLYTVIDGTEYCYVEHGTGETELYDLATDPWQMTSRHDDPEYAGLRARLRDELAVMRQ